VKVDRCDFFERNLLALSAQNPELCSRLRVALRVALGAAETGTGRYKFIESASGEVVPAIIDANGVARPLHSTVDPKREAGRLIASLDAKASYAKASGFLVFLGLGAGFLPEIALQLPDTSQIIVIDFDINGVAELFSSREYTSLLSDPRFTLLVDPDPGLIEKTILEIYRPALDGGIKVLPLRARTDLDKELFGKAADAVQHAIEKVSADYSVQAHFGTRWFANIIRNLGTAQGQRRSVPPVYGAAICAAGPSLDMQIPFLAEQREKQGAQNFFIICADTALPALLSRGVKPDAVVSIDCQHISYHRCMGNACRDIPLFLDLCSPPALAGFSDSPFFFSGGHPLAVYISQCWRPFPLLDTSGGNVTYACLSLAENLGAHRITVFGADFSYPFGKIYAKGTYLFPLFEKKQNRFSPIEAQVSALLFRSPFLPPENASIVATGNSCYETATLRFYRKAFEKKALETEAEIAAVSGLGIPLCLSAGNRNGHSRHTDKQKKNIFAAGKAETSAAEFLERYQRDIAALPIPGTGDIPAGAYLKTLDTCKRRIAATLLPQAAAVKRRKPDLTAGELIEEVKRYCIGEIDTNEKGKMKREKS
jgi:hypothetical protein